LFNIGGGLDFLQMKASDSGAGAPIAMLDPSYLRTILVAEIDSRTSPGYTTRGGLYRAEWSNYRQTSDGPYSFRRTDVEVQQFIPIMRDSWIIALRALASTTDTASTGEVPYFLMPDLGGSHTLRGYPTWRFRDRNRLLFSGEYRWTAGPFVDMSLFLDAGQVAPRRNDFTWSGFKKTYGVGVSLHTPTSTITRIELARTAEGTSFVFSVGPSF
jgi:outer membrane protein assembly factor BamA